MDLSSSEQSNFTDTDQKIQNANIMLPNDQQFKEDNAPFIDLSNDTIYSYPELSFSSAEDNNSSNEELMYYMGDYSNLPFEDFDEIPIHNKESIQQTIESPAPPPDEPSNTVNTVPLKQAISMPLKIQPPIQLKPDPSYITLLQNPNQPQFNSMFPSQVFNNKFYYQPALVAIPIKKPRVRRGFGEESQKTDPNDDFFYENKPCYNFVQSIALCLGIKKCSIDFLQELAKTIEDLNPKISRRTRMEKRRKNVLFSWFHRNWSQINRMKDKIVSQLEKRYGVV